MSRFGLLLSLISLLFVVSFAHSDSDRDLIDSVNATFSVSPSAVGAGFKSAAWRRVSRGAGWAGRAGGVVEWYSGRVRPEGSSSYQQGNWLLLYGAGAWTCWDNCVAREEVWASGNKGGTWLKVQPNQPFDAWLSPQTVQNSKGVQFRIQGTDDDHFCNDRANPGDVWRSTDGGYTWSNVGQVGSETGRFLGTAVADSRDYLYVMYGQDCTTALNDVWKSTNGGTTWANVKQTPNRSPPARSSHASVVGKFHEASGTSVDAIYMAFGWRGYGANGEGNVYTNDVWVSTNGAVNWIRLTERAAFPARGDSQLEVTNSGVLVIVGGVINIDPNQDRRDLNDVWASLDGGYTWGICAENSNWDDRVFPYTAIDNQGYLYVMGGWARDSAGENYMANDVWVSSQSFDDPAAVADMCGLILPPCGVGLRCLPNDNLVQGMWGVSCDACPWTPTTSASAPAASMTMTYLFVAFLLVSIALAAILAYFVYKMKQSGVSSPIPLPASAQRWWNDKPTGGLSDELNKGNTASDTMYNPLTIRDQM